MRARGVGRFALAALVVGAVTVSMPDASARGDRPFQPDGWIKLCGQSLGCVIDPPPHPWKGKDVYNRTGRRQTLSDDIDEGEGIRYWIVIQNDGTQDDTFDVDGCPGTRTFEVNRVLLGKHKRQDPGAEDLTRRYRNDTLTFALGAGDKAVFTLNVITHVRKGETYECRTVFTSEGDGRQDVVVARMTTF
jgi:hypothetical protein